MPVNSESPLVKNFSSVSLKPGNLASGESSKHGNRLTTSEKTFVPVATLLSSLRKDAENKKYESVSKNISRITKAGSEVEIPKVFSFNELSQLTGTLSGSATDSSKVETTQLDADKKELVTVFGWCKSIRKQDGGRLLFVIINDGSCKSNLQVVVHQGASGFDQASKSHSGASVRARGFLVDRFKGVSENGTESKVGGEGEEDYELLEAVSNKFEIHVTEVETNSVQILGANMYPNKYPISKKSVTLEHLRDIAHLRPRSYLISATMRIRSSLAMAIHLFFQSIGCNYLNSPIITTADCEGAGELFQVTTLLENVYRLSDLSAKMPGTEATASVASGANNDADVVDGGNNADAVDGSNGTNSDTVGVATNSGVTGTVDSGTTVTDGTISSASFAVSDINDVVVAGPVITTGTRSNRSGTVTKSNMIANAKVTYKNDFFKKKSYLTCSGQLSAENYCCSMGSVYTFGPTFRAENSHTSRHLAEFWMIEPELVLVDLPGLMSLTEQFIKFLVSYVLDHCYDDLHYFNNTVDNTLLERLKHVLNKEFGHVSYTKVIELLSEAVEESKDKPKFEYNDIHWGMDLQSEHERYISEEVFNGPVIIYNYPKTIKAFYMRRNEDKKTVAAMDLIIPKIGELIGGSQREERLDYLMDSIKENKLNEEDYWWYLDLRKYGTVVHSGFGLGFERLIMMVTGVNNIRDVIPFPRYPGHSAF
ncbi:asparaginyl-tRNA synthetase [Theileria orientalis]|uniref:asparagine--tRNA ligase n=1 Tax=Theileria orientalis TaxID=68886 RepID=A0A976MBV2_THEOR|nr:asparaginyl-tRNA synthetase [Theileria orientalis]